MSDPCVVTGLGNPGAEYEDTRHNAGFMLLDALASSWGWGWRRERRFQARVADGTWGGRRVILAKPETFMNRSGAAVGSICQYFHVRPLEVFVVVDDVDLPLGALRLRPGGSSGGHRGLMSIEQHLGTREYPRQKLGIARPAQRGQDMVDHVLGRFRPEERIVFDLVLERGMRQIESWLRDGVAKAMSEFNGTVVQTIRPAE